MTATFEPKVIPYLEAKHDIEVSPIIRGASPLTTRSIPALLKRSYKDESVDELFGTKSFPLLIQYDDGGMATQQYQTECEILYRPWKQHVDIGLTRRTVRAAAAR